MPAGEPYGSSVALPALSDTQNSDGVALLGHWAPTTRLRVELGHTPTSFEVANVTGALRYRIDTAGGPWNFGLERSGRRFAAVAGGVIDPVTGH